MTTRYAPQTHYHGAVPVEAAGRSDAELASLIAHVPGARTAGDVRRACRRAAAQGLHWVPPCSQVREDGLCRGHFDPQADTWGT